MKTEATADTRAIKGPLVYRNYSQSQLDAAYNQATYAPNANLIHARRNKNSEEARRRLGEPLRLPYGVSEIEKLDLYQSSRRPAPVFIFIHGGAWRNGSASQSAFSAEAFIHSGIHFIALDFVSIDEAGKQLGLLVQQIRSAISWVYLNGSQYGIDTDRIYVGGHSSGAHLASVMLTTDWTDLNLPRNLIKGGLCCSGMYDLLPVSLSSRSNYVDFNPEVIQNYSAIRNLVNLTCHVIVAVGTCESPEFQRQNIEFAQAIEAFGKEAELIIADSYNHFEIIETLANPYGWLGRAVISMINSSS